MKSVSKDAASVREEARQQATQSLALRVRSGVLWTLLGNISQQVLRIGFSVALARLLSPREFGLIGMAAVFTGFASMYVSLGLGQAIVQRKDLSPQHLSSAFTISLSSAAVLCLLLNLFAAPIANIYQEPALKPIIHVLSFQFVLSAFTLVHSALLQRGMRFKELSLIELTSFIAGSLTAVAVAWFGGGVWSLVANAMTMSSTSLVLLWWRSGWKPSFGFVKSAAADLWAYSKNLVGFNTIYYWARNADSYLIGKYCGAVDLGVYSRAYQLMMLPITQITQVVSSVMFPALCRVGHDITRLRDAILRAHRTIALVSFPTMVMVSLLAEPLILAVFGEKWRGVVPMLRVLAWTGLGQSLGIQHLIYNTLGRTDVTFKIGGLNSALMIFSFLVGLPWGAVGVAVSYTIIWWAFVFPIGWSVASRMIGTSLTQILWNLREVVICTIVMGVFVQFTYLFSRGLVHPIIQLLLSSTIGCAAYVVAVRALRVRAYHEALSLTRNKRNAFSRSTNHVPNASDS